MRKRVQRPPGEYVFLSYRGRCPVCRGKVEVRKEHFLDMPSPPRGRCFYAKWTRDGIPEHGGICTRQYRK